MQVACLLLFLALHRGGLESAYALLYCTRIARELYGNCTRRYREGLCRDREGAGYFLVGPLHFFFGMFADMEKL